ncbi:MAG: T9SS type A sorting domain-containing protein [Candidatus Coatesbacteria bacterium]|nr:MAG: T9SS type A sorting domain-containing protein [Candidatus Coatesbacteria bacterium]
MVKIMLAAALSAATAFAGTLAFVEPVGDTAAERGSELEIVVRNDTGENAPVYLVSNEAHVALFTALANDITRYFLDTGDLDAGTYALEARSDLAPTANVSVCVKAAGTESGQPKVYPLPNPFDLSALAGEVTFVNTAAGSVVTIFDMGGREVAKLTDTYTWNGRNDRGDLVSSGTYVYHISSPGGLEFTGKLAVVK